jgi:hypothetical protein
MLVVCQPPAKAEGSMVAEVCLLCHVVVEHPMAFPVAEHLMCAEEQPCLAV